MTGGRRPIVVLAAVLGAVVFVSTAAADKPVKIDVPEFTFSAVLSGACSFDVNVESVVNATEIDYFDTAGNLIRVQLHQVEQDTFTANGKTLTGIPFTFNVQIGFDDNGEIVSVVATGLAEKIRLPDGSLFVAAGWLDFADHPGATFLISPDRGNPGNIEGFCAALAP